MKRLEYEQPEPISREDAERALAAGSPDEIERVLLSVTLFDPDLEFAYGLVLRFSSANDPGIRGTAVLCIGHLARIHRHLPDFRVRMIIEAALRDSSDYVRAQAENAADDVELFFAALGTIDRQSSQ